MSFFETQTRRRGLALYADVAKELDPVERLFSQWERDAAAKRSERAQEFPNFDAALTVFNSKGERQVRTVTIQEWYFTPRRQVAAVPSSSHHSHTCTRCFTNIARHTDFFVDRAKQPSHADVLCRHCLVCCMRRMLGQDDAALVAEAQRLSRWHPTVDADLAGKWAERRVCPSFCHCSVSRPLTTLYVTVHADALLQTRIFFSD